MAKLTLNKKNPVKIIALFLLCSVTAFAYAASDGTDISIKVTEDAYIKLLGSLTGKGTISLNIDDADDKLITLGTLGAESNTIGRCDVYFSSINDFKFRHHQNPALFLHGTQSYSVFWKSNMIGVGRLHKVGLTSCNPVTQKVQLKTPALPAMVSSGTYSDTIRITIVTQ